MKVELTLRMLLAFVVPGSIVAGSASLSDVGFAWLSIDAEEAISAVEITIAVAGIFVVGTLVDSVRLVTVQFLVRFVVALLNIPGIPDGYIKKIAPDNIDVFTLITDRTFEYYRLNANAATAFAIGAIIGVSLGISWFWGGILTGLAVVAFSIAVVAYVDTAAAVKGFCDGVDERANTDRMTEE